MEVSNMKFPQIYDCGSSSSSSPQPPLPPISSQAQAPPPPPPSPPPPPPSSSGFPATVHQPPSAPSLNQHSMYKNRLQEFTQKSNISLPMYQTVNEGTQHAPRFKSTVWVDGKSYTSQITSPQRKAAEQDVARLALECLSKKFRDEGSPIVRENTLFSKSILNEYATKLNVERPTYKTVQQEGLLPVFVSSLVFNGTMYTGEPARNKKEAEQLAARAVLLSILGDSGAGALFEIIKSKSKIYAAVKLTNSQSSDASVVSAISNTGHTSVTQDLKDKEVAGLVAASNNETKVELPEPSKIASSCQEFQMPKQEPNPEATTLPSASLQTSSEQLTGEGSSSKKRRKNKKKANKKGRLESPSPLPIAAFPLNEVPPCSVAQ